MRSRAQTVAAGLVLCTAATLTVPAGCSFSQRRHGPWYDLETVWLNRPMRSGGGPERPVDLQAAQRAAQARETEWAASGAPAATDGEADRRRRTWRAAGSEAPAMVLADRAARSSGGAGPSLGAAASRGEVTGAESARARRPPPAAVRRSDVTRSRAPVAAHGAAPGPVPPPDASRAGRLLEAARRLDGVHLDGELLVTHLLASVGVRPGRDLELPEDAVGPRYLHGLFRAYAAQGRTFVRGTPSSGDLVFLHGTWDVDGDGDLAGLDPFTGVAVVDTVRGDGAVLAWGEVRGEVRRFVMDPARPWVVRDRGGDTVNSVLRARALGSSPDLPVLAGALFAGYARP